MRLPRFVIAIALGLLAGTVNAAAQGPYRVGLLSPGPPLAEGNPYGGGLVRGFAQQGYVVGRNLVFERRGAEMQLDRLPTLAEELVASKVDVIVAVGHLAALAAKRTTNKVPIVVVGAGDIVDSGLIDSLARPGGNLTGVSEAAPELSTKRLELLKEAVPSVHRVAMLWNAADVAMTHRYQAASGAARTLDLLVQPFGVRGPADFDDAFVAMARDMPDAILLVSDALTALNHKHVLKFANAHKLPIVYEYERYVHDGGFMSYGPDQGELAERAAELAVRILKGARPSDLPAEQPTRFRLVINLQTAKTLGLALTQPILLRADEVIE